MLPCIYSLSALGPLFLFNQKLLTPESFFVVSEAVNMNFVLIGFELIFEFSSISFACYYCLFYFKGVGDENEMNKFNLDVSVTPHWAI